MAQLPNLLVNAVSTFDGKALAKGQKTVASFAKNVARSLGVAFGTAGVIAFGKASIKAFAEDEKAAARLSRTVNNLGLGFENTRITKFIGDLEKSANVADDVLRPAFQALITTTRDSAKSQQLLGLALDISAGSGEDVVTVANDLSKAYVGTTKGLIKYNLGLTKAQLSTKSFAELQEILNNQFSGQNAARLDTYAGKVDALRVSFGITQELVGEGLVDAFTILAGDNGIEGATNAMEDFGTTARDVLTGTASYVDKLLDKFNSGKGGLDLGLIPILGGYLGKGGVLDKLAAEGRKVTGRDKQYGGVYADQYNMQKDAADAKARDKIARDQEKRQKELIALQKKSALAEKNKLSLSKAAAVFDSTRISIAAALQATYDKETRLRLEALMAIEDDNGALALRKINELAALQKNADLAKLAGITTVSDAALQALNTQLLAELKGINTSKMAESEKESLRDIAFKKYNAAILASGELAAKESYSERVQIQLTEIARLAALSNTTNAMLTSNMLRESAELEMIDRVSSAQSKADAARQAALENYIRLLNSVGSGITGAGTTPGSAGGGGGTSGVGGTSGGGTKPLTAAEVSGMRYAAQAEAQYKADLAKISLTDKVARASLNQGLSAGLSLPSALSGARYAAQAAAQYNLTVNAGVVSQPDELVTLIQNSIQKLNRAGDPLTPAGKIK
jgi:hypothetical protein